MNRFKVFVKKVLAGFTAWQLLLAIILIPSATPNIAIASDTGLTAPNQTISSNSVSNPDRGWASDDSRATFDNSGDNVEYGFPDLGLPAGVVVDGVEVTIEAQTTGRNLTAALWNMSNSSPDAYTSFKTASLSNSDTLQVLGGSSDKWGKTWAISDFADSGFKIKVGATSGGGDALLDQLRVKVYYSVPDTTAPTAPGAPTTTSPTTDRTPTWTWAASTDNIGVDHYVIYWDKDEGGTEHHSSNIPAGTTSFTHSGSLDTGTWYAKVKAFDAAGNSTFSENGSVVISNRITSSATLNGLSAVVVKPGTLINAAVTGTIMGDDHGDWEGTEYRVSTTDSGSMTCVNTSDSDDSGTYTKSFTFDAPSAPGVYNVYFRINGEDDCDDDCDDNERGTLLTMTGAITVDDVAPVFEPFPDISVGNDLGLPSAVVYYAPTATDNIDPSVTVNCIPASGATFLIGTTLVTCTAIDSAGNSATLTFNVVVSDDEAPVVTLIGDNPQTIERGTPYIELGATVTDNYDTGLSAIIGFSSVDTAITGVYYVTYDAVDSSGNDAVQVTRTINVVDTIAPIITLIGGNPITIMAGETFIDPGATTDDGSPVIVTGVVNPAVEGSYTLTYSSMDGSENSAQPVTRVVNVIPVPILPPLTLPLTPLVLAAAAAPTAPAVAGAVTEQPKTPEVKGTDTNSDVKGSSDTVCPWWWIIALALIVVLAFVGGVVGAAQENSVLKKYYYVWPVALGAVAWVAHYFLHNDFKATWFCNNYWLVVLLLAVIAEFVYRSMVKKSEK